MAQEAQLADRVGEYVVQFPKLLASAGVPINTGNAAIRKPGLEIFIDSKKTSYRGQNKNYKT